MNIEYLNGDATAPTVNGTKIIVHVCNDIGGWGRGFVMAVSKKWQKPEQEYRAWHKSGEGFELGNVQFVQVEPEIWISNMIGQRGIRSKNGIPPIRYEAVGLCLDKVAEKAVELSASVHMPRIGCGLAGGRWEEIEPLIMRSLLSNNIKTYVYDFG